MGLKITAHAQLGQNYGQRIQNKPKNPVAIFKEPGAKVSCQEEKQGTAHDPCTQHLLVQFSSVAESCLSL